MTYNLLPQMELDGEAALSSYEAGGSNSGQMDH